MFLPESYPDKIHADLLALGYEGSTLDMLLEYLQAWEYTGFLENMWAEYLADQEFDALTHDELIAELNAGTLLVEVT